MNNDILTADLLRTLPPSLQRRTYESTCRVLPTNYTIRWAL